MTSNKTKTIQIPADLITSLKYALGLEEPTHQPNQLTLDIVAYSIIDWADQHQEQEQTNANKPHPHTQH